MSILFHEIQIGDTFGWRGSTWTKTDQTHAVPVGSNAAACEHVPSHDAVVMVLNADRVTPPPDDPGEPGGESPRTIPVS